MKSSYLSSIKDLSEPPIIPLLTTHNTTMEMTPWLEGLGSPGARAMHNEHYRAPGWNAASLLCPACFLI